MAPRRGLLAWLIARLVTLTWSYGTVLGLWLLMRFVLEDFSWWSFALNSMLLYAFLPLPDVLPVAMLSRRREVGAIFVAGVAVWAWQWGGLFLPGTLAAPRSSPTLSVMSYNVLGYNFETGAVLATTGRAGADVVALQELNPENAEAIARELRAEYLYQALPGSAGTTASATKRLCTFGPWSH